MTLLLPDGRQLNYLDVGQGPVLVLLHGWGMSSGIFSDIIDDLAKDFRLLVPDLRGHGQSDAGADYALSDFADDFTIWFNCLELDRCKLIGWSFGGQISLQLLAEKVLPIDRLILVSSTPKFCQSAEWQYGLPEIQVRAMQRQFRRDSEMALTEFMSMMFTGNENATLLAAEARQKNISPGHDAGDQSLATLKSVDIRGQLATIGVPTLIHHGKADTIIPPSAGKYIADNIAGAESVVWNDVGHAPFLSRPQASQALWKEFML